MNYLMYIQGGVIRKRALDKPVILIGRSARCDIVLPDPEVSKIHCRVDVSPDHLLITDQKSKNGVTIGQARISKASLALNSSFCIQTTEFFFKKGEVKEFALSRELSGMITAMARMKSPEEIEKTKAQELETKDSGTKFTPLLPRLVELAILTDDLPRFIAGIREMVGALIPAAGLVLHHRGHKIVIFDHLELDRRLPSGSTPETTPDDQGKIVHAGGTTTFRRFRHSASDDFLMFYSDDPRLAKRAALLDFVQKLLEIIIFHLKLIPSVSFDPAPVPVLFEREGITIVGKSPALKRLLDIAIKIAPKTTFILIMGESGTGKEQFARLIHMVSGRGRFEAINCAAIPAALLESELFGYEAGAFTDARKGKAGKIEVASGGTLVLDEIGDMPLEVQAKLLRVIQERSVTRLGSNTPVPVDLRLIAMTNRDLYRLVEEKKFRQDLFFRLRVHELTLPPLRERPDDIPALILYFARRYATRNGVEPMGFSESVFDCFRTYSWPGNIRELENEIMRIMEIVGDHELIGDQFITPSIIESCRNRPSISGSDLPYREKIDRFEKEELRRLLEAKGGNKSEAARAIGMTYQGLVKKMKKLGLG